jgi:hypothetical protein
MPTAYNKCKSAWAPITELYKERGGNYPRIKDVCIKTCENIYNPEQPLSSRQKRSEWTMRHKRSESAETEIRPILEYLQHALKIFIQNGREIMEKKMFRRAGVWTKYVYQTVKRKSTFYAEVISKPMSSEAIFSGSWNDYFLLILQSIWLFS